MGINRRNNLLANVEAEMKIREVMRAVESMGCDELLTKAVVHLDDALKAVSDYVDKKMLTRTYTATSPIKRYDLIYDNKASPSKYRISESDTGEFVKFEDVKTFEVYEAALQTIAELCTDASARMCAIAALGFTKDGCR
jgi:hypothetical protein